VLFHSVQRTGITTTVCTLYLLLLLLLLLLFITQVDISLIQHVFIASTVYYSQKLQLTSRMHTKQCERNVWMTENLLLFTWTQEDHCQTWHHLDTQQPAHYLLQWLSPETNSHTIWHNVMHNILSIFITAAQIKWKCETKPRRKFITTACKKSLYTSESLL